MDVKAPVSVPEYFFPIVCGRDKFSNHETNQNDENAMRYCLSEYLRMCF